MAFSPYDYPDAFTRVFVGTTWSPGTVKLSGHDRQLNWDVQKPKGMEGASSKLNGNDLGEFQMTFYLADNDELTEFDSFADLLRSTVNGPQPKALPIYHPDLERNGYTDIVLDNMGGRVWDDRGGCTIIVKVREHKPPKPKKPVVASSKPAGGVNAKPDPNAKRKQELDALIAQAKQP